MPIRDAQPDIVRIVEGLSGKVTMQLELIIRFDYGNIVPWVRKDELGLHAIAGPDALLFKTPITTQGRGLTTVAEFEIKEGQRVPFVLTWHPSHLPPGSAIDPFAATDETCEFWREWASRCTDEGPYKDFIVRSLITLKGLTYAPTGGIVAAGTTSLPEKIGGVRNWDYRYCWLRDATLTLLALIEGGYLDEAHAWRDWLLRAVAGVPSKLQIMYGLQGERRLDEREIEWLPGYEASKPVRVGNAAATQLQLDVYGEVSDTFHQARRAGLDLEEPAWVLQSTITNWLESAWKLPDEGLWEVRGGPRQHTHSKVMAWVAMDRAIKAVERYGMQGPVEHWRATARAIHEEVCRLGYDAEKGTFTQSYGSPLLDASLLLIPSVGFLPASDPRVLGTIAAVERELLNNGLVRRYLTVQDDNPDGLPGEEGVFLACSFWLVDAYVLTGRLRDAQALFEKLIALCNDVGLLSEQYDPVQRRLTGNFPQAFSHVALINSARNLTRAQGPAQQRQST
jgi:GH15 family glucan-1,4-alpha-glucosidase